MNKKMILWSAWGILYVICVPFGYVNEPSHSQSVGMFLLGLIFFLPGALLLIDALRTDDKKTIRLLRLVSGLSLGLTLCFYVANILSALASDSLGDLLHGFLTLVSVPLFCCRMPALTFLLWAILLFSTIVKIPKSLDK